MPSSPGPASYQTAPLRFIYRGITLGPPDALPDGKVAFAQNIRSWEDGCVTPRNGLTRVTGFSIGGAVVTLARLNDPDELGGFAERRFLFGDNGEVWGGIPGAVGYVEVDSGFSGEPVTTVAAAPANSPQPWLYVGDFDKIRKYDTGMVDRSIGMAPPASAPTAALAAIKVTFLESIDAASWEPYGDEAGAVTPGTRLATTINVIVYDTGATGMASINLASMDGISRGTTVDLGAVHETAAVLEVIPAVATTTIAGILYDNGVNGFCTIQPTGGFALGQLEIADPEQIRRRYDDLDSPVAPGVTITRPVDFAVGGLVGLGAAAEVVQILSIAIGPDGVMSFRAFTAGTHAAAAAIIGFPTLRAYLNTTVALGEPAEIVQNENVITPASADTPAYAGIQCTIASGSRDWSQVGDRAMTPEDVITFSIKCSAIAGVEFVRLILASADVGVSADDALVQNFYQYEWRASDLATAIQLTSATPGAVAPTADAQADAVVQGQVDTFYANQFGTDPLIIGGLAPGESGTLPITSPGDDTQPRRTDGFVNTGSTPGRQLALGNDQWITLQCRVKDLTRVGTNPARSLSNLTHAAIALQISGSTDPVTVSYCDVYLQGGYGPDVGQTNPPIVYRARYRSTTTGERSNPSPTMRAGVVPRRGRVDLSIAGSSAEQCDVVDWFRFGGSLARWTYVKTSPNEVGGTVTDTDDMADHEIDGGETLRVDLFQPWPTSDLPRAGTCRVVGTAVQWVSGDVFNTEWAPDTGIIINGRATQLYGSPSSTTRLEVIDSCDADATAAFTIPSPTLMAQPLPAMWGGTVEGVWFHFAVGDPNDPGAVHWTNGNDPDSASDANVLVVTSPSEPLQNGFIDDGQAYVFSTDRLFRLTLAQDARGRPTFRADPTACSRGLWNRWALAVGIEGTYFIAKDGPFLTSRGSQEVSIGDPDLRAILPRDGTTAQPGPFCLLPIDFYGPMALTVVDQMVYWDYRDTAASGRTLVFEPLYRRWTPDLYGASAVRSRIAEPGPLVHTNVVGCANGNAYEVDGSKTTDDGTAISYLISTPWASPGDPRDLKQFGDCVLDADSGGSFDGIYATPVIDNGRTALSTQIVGYRVNGRDTYLVEVAASGGTEGAGVLSRNFGLLIAGVTQINDIRRPRLYLWEPSYLSKGTPVARRATDWEDLGYPGAKFVQGIVIRANTFNQAKSVVVQADGAAAGITLSLTHNGELEKAYPLAAAGWTPFTAQLVRLLGNDDLEWTLLNWRWVFEPAPELATQWETQDTSFDFPGYGTVRDGVIALQSTAEVTLRVFHDATGVNYAIPSTGGIYQRVYVPFGAAKGLSYKFRLTSDEPFRVWQKDISVRAQPWGIPGGYQSLRPFGGSSRIAGAEI